MTERSNSFISRSFRVWSFRESLSYFLFSYVFLLFAPYVRQRQKLSVWMVEDKYISLLRSPAWCIPFSMQYLWPSLYWQLFYNLPKLEGYLGKKSHIETCLPSYSSRGRSPLTADKKLLNRFHFQPLSFSFVLPQELFMEMTNVLWWIKLASVFLMKSSQSDGGKFYFMIVPAKN